MVGYIHVTEWCSWYSFTLVTFGNGFECRGSHAHWGFALKHELNILGVLNTVDILTVDEGEEQPNTCRDTN